QENDTFFHNSLSLKIVRWGDDTLRIKTTQIIREVLGAVKVIIGNILGDIPQKISIVVINR
ncbi:MAG: hypothetical protein PHR69_06190, partial [Sphaerochaeta sp.]|nr:hypothetical protein [Sphaerochaeta sp.]